MAKKTGGRLFWLLAGAALGAVGRILWERRQGGRLADPMHRTLRPKPMKPIGQAGIAARLARQSLRADPALAGLGIRVLPVSAGTVELHGWVASRALRTLALRAVRATPTVDRVINNLLVHGEDDLSIADTADDHSA
ncbi:MAG: BON domain-containing protein [Gemmatimonadales bacterium]